MNGVHCHASATSSATNGHLPSIVKSIATG